MEKIRSTTRSLKGRACKKLGGISDYGTPEKVLGKGGFGEVKLLSGSKESPGKVAAKTIKATNVDGSLAIDFIRESSILISTRAAGIVKLLDIEIDVDTITLYEADAGEKLWGMVLSEEDFRPLFYAALRILSALELQGVVHGDIKAPNFLYQNRELTLIDFGASSQLIRTDKGLSRTLSYIGTDYYMSPERLRKEPYNDRADVWAAACMWMTVVGPFIENQYVKTPEEIIKSFVKDQEYRESWIAKFSPSARVLLKKMLDPNPETRISASDCLSHPFFQPLIKSNTPVKQLRFSPRQALNKRSEKPEWSTDFLDDRANELAWMIEVCRVINISLDVYFLAVKLIDFILERDSSGFNRNPVLRSLVCLSLSSKLLMGNPPVIQMFINQAPNGSNVKADAFLRVERRIYSLCCFTINYATSFDFIRLHSPTSDAVTRLRVLLRTSLANSLSDEELAKKALQPDQETLVAFNAEYTKEVDDVPLKYDETQ